MGRAYRDGRAGDRAGERTDGRTAAMTHDEHLVKRHRPLLVRSDRLWSTTPTESCLRSEVPHVGRPADRIRSTVWSVRRVSGVLGPVEKDRRSFIKPVVDEIGLGGGRDGTRRASDVVGVGR